MQTALWKGTATISISVAITDRCCRGIEWYGGPQGTRCKQKRNAANKKEALQTKKGTAANIKKGTLQIKKRNAANKKEHIMRSHTVPEGLGRVLPS